MKKSFEPNYNNLVSAAKNLVAERMPLYEHKIANSQLESIMGLKANSLNYMGEEEIEAYFKYYCEAYKNLGYDTVSWEGCLGATMPYSGALGGHVDPAIKNREDYLKYPWDLVVPRYFEKNEIRLEILRKALPDGMKVVGGVGNGVFECVQELVGYTNLCFLKYDDEELYADLFKKIGNLLYEIWDRMLTNYGDVLCVCRMGDDLGFKNSTLLSTEDISTHIIPQYKRIVERVHKAGKPFLLHSCGCIFSVMDEFIDTVKIDAKHSNEDIIEPFVGWVERYGAKIGNFGGVDTDALCNSSEEEIEKYTLNILEDIGDLRGIAFGSGNSIPAYVPTNIYRKMVATVRRFRGEIL